jgi:short-subunit dehydrogenase
LEEATMGAWTGKNIVVVGGSLGVGRAVVEAAANAGAHVLAVARGADALEEIASVGKGVATLV